MILTPDSSAQATMATSPAPESPISSISSHGSRASSVSRMSCVSQGMSSPYHVAQLPHHLSPNMPTMDSTVSSAKPEPELNIGTSRKKIELSVNVHKRKKKNIFLYYPFLLPNFFTQRNRIGKLWNLDQVRDTREYYTGWSISLLSEMVQKRKKEKKKIARRDSGVKAESCNTPML